MEFPAIRQGIDALAQKFAAERLIRQRRTSLEPADFDELRRAGYPLVVVPAEQGGVFTDAASSVRPLCGILRALGRGDSSVALVCAMHPAVLIQWLTFPSVEIEHQAAWQQQRDTLFRHAREGAFFGTITSEPGSGGDVSLTRAVARRAASGYKLSGQKHFGSGCGIASLMVTTAIPEGEKEADWFVLDMRDIRWDGSQGITLASAWEGHGMQATQSHALTFSDFPVERCAWPRHRSALSSSASAFVVCLFAAVIAGIVDAAMEIAQTQLCGRRGALRPFEQVEWTRAELDAWLLAQAFEGMLKAAEAQPPRDKEALLGKMAVAELAESCLSRLCRVLGGGSYSRRSAIGYLFEDVRALGFLRPPWALAFDNLSVRDS